MTACEILSRRNLLIGRIQKGHTSLWSKPRMTNPQLASYSMETSRKVSSEIRNKTAMLWRGCLPFMPRPWKSHSITSVTKPSKAHPSPREGNVDAPLGWKAARSGLRRACGPGDTSAGVLRKCNLPGSHTRQGRASEDCLEKLDRHVGKCMNLKEYPLKT